MRNQFEYFDRDLSWLSFNYRVLEEARDEDLPLFERIKFLAIYSSNLDEFFRVRVAGLRSLIEVGKKKINEQLQVEPKSLLKKILETVNRHQEEFGEIWRNQLLPALHSNNIILYPDELVLEEHKPFIRHYFKSNVLSFLQPVILDEESESPFLENRQLYLALKLIKPGVKDKFDVGILNIPSDHLDRYVALPGIEEKNYFITLDDIIRIHLDSVFPGYEIDGVYSIKLNRDAELNIDDEFTGDLVKKITKQLSKRNIGAPSRFLYDQTMPADMLRFLKMFFGLRQSDLIPGGRYHNLNDLFGLKNPKRPELENPPLPPIEVNEIEDSSSLFELMDRKDVILHFPYQSYDTVLRFFNEAAVDPDVKEIKATFYRVAADSYIMNALISAATNGKKVTVFIEVKARFDEWNNLKWAEKMEEAGVRIIYSIPGLKVHAKVALVKRQDEDGKIRGYGFFGTGNFNEKTASIYADHGLLSANQNMTDELDDLFKYLYKRKEVEGFEDLLISQFNMRDRFLELINFEIEQARHGKRSHILIKVNNLEERSMIDKLYDASNAGVKIKILVRSICCLIPGVKGMSENIAVSRIVDRYLEHARVFMFHHAGEELLFLGSADWMKRNLFHRIEVIFPLYDESTRNEIRQMIAFQVKDNTKARILDEELNNNKILRLEGSKDVRAQLDFYKWLKKKSS